MKDSNAQAGQVPFHRFKPCQHFLDGITACTTGCISRWPVRRYCTTKRGKLVLGLAFLAFSAYAQTPATGTVTIPSVPNVPICAGVPWGDFWGVTVNGVTAQVTDYPPPSTTTSVAQQLAAKINSVITFVTATASQNVITITTKATGSGTNYPFSGYFGPYQIDGNFHPQCIGFLSGLPTSGQTLTGGMAAPVPGYINPKFMILGVTYAPPGTQSSVTYTDSTLVGNSTTINKSFNDQTSVSVQVTAGVGAFGNGGKISGTETTSYAQMSSSSDSVTINKTIQVSDKTPGPLNSLTGINHDFDVVWLWLNPVLPFTANTSVNPPALTWDGYGYDPKDQPGLDVFPVYIGWLNGDIPIPGNVATVLARTWASSYSWGSGQGPGLTGPGPNTDLDTIARADPFWQCTQVPSACPTTPDPVRFTISDNQNFVYEQAPVGGQPITQTYQLQYAKTSTHGQTTGTTFSQAFGLDLQFNASSFISSLMVDLKLSNTLTWTASVNNVATNTATSTALASITGPSCTVNNGSNVCAPQYTGPIEFEIYQDNQYGTFMFFPVNGVSGAPLSMPTSTSLPTPSSGLPFGPQLLTATGGSGTGYSWCVQSGSQCVQSGPPMPPGFSLDSKSSCGNACTQVALSSTGTPPAPAGSYNFTVQVTDSGGHLATQPVSINIAEGPANVTGQVAITSSGLAYSRVTQTFNGTLTLKNLGVTAIGGPLQLLLFGVPANVILLNATGSVSTTPYITLPATGGLPPGESITVSVQFKNPSNGNINFTPAIYSGRIN